MIGQLSFISLRDYVKVNLICASFTIKCYDMVQFLSAIWKIKYENTLNARKT